MLFSCKLHSDKPALDFPCYSTLVRSSKHCLMLKCCDSVFISINEPKHVFPWK